MVMEAVMILKNSEPTWAEAKRQLSDVNFLTSVSNVVASKACKCTFYLFDEFYMCVRTNSLRFDSQLRDFDKDHISDRILRTIGKYTSNPEFDPIKVGVVSVAAKSLCMWVIAMEKYGKLYR